MSSKIKYSNFIVDLPKEVKLIAVSKTKSDDEILEIYHCGQRDFGENYVQELISKQERLPKDIRWHFIGHLQTNKVKFIALFVHLIHSVDSLKLLKEINKQAEKLDRVIPVLIQVHVAKEETKFGFDPSEVKDLFNSNDLLVMNHILINGLMGMASNTDDESAIKNEFNELKELFDVGQKIHSKQIDMKFLSMGMSGDYKLAIESGSNMIRIGSLLFGERNYRK